MLTQLAKPRSVAMEVFDISKLPKAFKLKRHGMLCHFVSICQLLVTCTSAHSVLSKYKGESYILNALKELFTSPERFRLLLPGEIITYMMTSRKELSDRWNAARQEDPTEDLFTLLDTVEYSPFIGLFEHAYTVDTICMGCVSRRSNSAFEGDICKPVRSVRTIGNLFFLLDEVKDPIEAIKTKTELIDDYRCEKCCANAIATKVMKLSMVSEVVIIVMQKYQKKWVQLFPSTFELRGKSGMMKYSRIAQLDHLGAGTTGGHYVARCIRDDGNVHLLNDDNEPKVTVFEDTKDTYAVVYHLM